MAVLGVDKKQACFLSYNSRGFSNLKSDFINNLVSQAVVGKKLPILCNQEHFM